MEDDKKKRIVESLKRSFEQGPQAQSPSAPPPDTAPSDKEKQDRWAKIRAAFGG